MPGNVTSLFTILFALSIKFHDELRRGLSRSNHESDRYAMRFSTRAESRRNRFLPISLTWLAAHCAFFANRRVIARRRVDKCPPTCSRRSPGPSPKDRTATLRCSVSLPTKSSRPPRVWKEKKIQTFSVHTCYYGDISQRDANVSGKSQVSLTRSAPSSAGSAPPPVISHFCD